MIPIDRVKHTATEVNNLRDELQAMIKGAVPLVWSTNDIQTLINAYIEDMDKASAKDKGDKALIRAWQELFSLLSSSAEIVGDEIHAILDILQT